MRASESRAPAIANVDEASSLRITKDHESPLSRRQSLQLGPPQVVRHHVVERLLLLGRPELLRDRDAVGVADVLDDLPAQRPMAHRFQARLQVLEAAVVGEA